MTLFDFAIRLGMAFFLGAAIGMERQWRQRMAGLRTNTLVSTGSALFVMLAVLVANDSSPTRIAAQVVSGIGFLGAGVIMRDGLTVRGLNTAATLWCSAAIGTMTGSGFLAEAMLGAAAILAANVLLRSFAHKLEKLPGNDVEEEFHYSISVTCRADSEAQVRLLLLQMVSEEQLMLSSLRSEDLEDQIKVMVQARLISHVGRKDQNVEKIVGRVSLEPSVTAVSWRLAPVENE